MCIDSTISVGTSSKEEKLSECRRENSPPDASNSLWLPISTILPSCITTILWAFLTVASRWAIIITVRFTISLSRAFCIRSSLSESIEAVASSRIKIGASVTSALAKAISCLSGYQSLNVILSKFFSTFKTHMDENKYGNSILFG